MFVCLGVMHLCLCVAFVMYLGDIVRVALIVLLLGWLCAMLCVFLFLLCCVFRV